LAAKIGCNVEIFFAFSGDEALEPETQMTDPTDSRRRLPARSAFLQPRNPGRPVVVFEEDPEFSPEHPPEAPKPSADAKSAGSSPDLK
jgi:hypothetical protein